MACSVAANVTNIQTLGLNCSLVKTDIPRLLLENSFYKLIYIEL